MRVARNRRRIAREIKRTERSMIKDFLFKKRGISNWEEEATNPKIREQLAKERKLITRMNQFAAKDETLELLTGLYLEMRNQLGNLKGKRVLTVSERPDFVRFLVEGEKAHVVPLSFRGGVFQETNLSHITGTMDCLVANAVFERDAFFYTAMDYPSSIRFKDKSENLKATVAERVKTLGKINEALKKGGKVIKRGKSNYHWHLKQNNVQTPRNCSSWI